MQRYIIVCVAAGSFVPEVGRHNKGQSNKSCKGLCALCPCLCYRNLGFSYLFCDVTYLTNAYFEGTVIKIFIMDNDMGVCVRRRLDSKNNPHPNLMNYLARFLNWQDVRSTKIKKSAYDKRRGENRQHLEPDRANWFEMECLYSVKNECHCRSILNATSAWPLNLITLEYFSLNSYVTLKH